MTITHTGGTSRSRTPSRTAAEGSDATRLRLTGPLGRRVLERRSELRDITAAHGVSNVCVFGSVARGEETTDSDIDFLVDVAPGVGLLGLARLQRELEGVLEARVELVPADCLKPMIRPDVDTDLIPL